MDNIQVSVILGSDSDVDLGKAAIKSLKSFDISCELKVISAHRSPDVLVDYLKSSKERGCKAYIAIAGMAAHLAGAVAAHSASPVLGVPTAHSLNGLDAILSTLQMPAGVPVATFAAGTAGATNAGIFAAQMIATTDDQMAERMKEFKKELREKNHPERQKSGQRLKVTQSLITASGIIKSGGVIAYPTEGIWGIGGLNAPEIQQKIYLAKKRDDSKKFILLFKSSDQLFEHFPEAEKYKETINSFKNSFTTILLPLEKGKTAIRIPNYKRLVEFLGLIDKPLISTSANISGNEVCKTIEEIENIFKDKIEGILDMPLGGEKNPSRIYDLELDEYIR